MAFGDAVISASGPRSAAALCGIAGRTGNDTPLQAPSNIDPIAFDVAAHRASTSAFH
jgi:hypothetical protein